MRSPGLIISWALVGALAPATACGGGDNTTTATPTGAASASVSPMPAATVEGVSDLAYAVVEIIAVDSSGNPVWSGSGTLISADGLS
jgi:hypothetical protein